MLISPLCLLCLVNCEGSGCFLLVQLERILEVGQFVSILVVFSLFFNAKVLGLWKSDDFGLVGLLVHEVMWEVKKFMGLEVKYCDSVLSGFSKDGLTVTE